MNKDLIDLTQLTKEEILSILNLSDNIKKNPSKYSQILKGKTLLMIFEKPSLRTRVSFETGMTQMGGHGIYYDLSTSPMGKKESVSDTAKTASKYVDIIMARLFLHQQIEELAKNSEVPVINALTNFSHPCQILADFQTIREKKNKLTGLKLAYVGDSNNNVTHSLLFGCSIIGIDIFIGCPEGKEYEPQQEVVKKAKELAEKIDSKVVITNNPIEAVSNADIVYTDSWMSYHISEDQQKSRVNIFMPFQVNQNLLNYAKSDVIFMNCLPAIRGMEQTTEVIDGPNSVVFDEAENRLHTQKALVLKLLNLV